MATDTQEIINKMIAALPYTGHCVLCGEADYEPLCPSCTREIGMALLESTDEDVLDDSGTTALDRNFGVKS